MQTKQTASFEMVKWLLNSVLYNHFYQKIAPQSFFCDSTFSNDFSPRGRCVHTWSNNVAGGNVRTFSTFGCGWRSQHIGRMAVQKTSTLWCLRRQGSPRQLTSTSNPRVQTLAQQLYSEEEREHQKAETERTRQKAYPGLQQTRALTPAHTRCKRVMPSFNTLIGN